MIYRAIVDQKPDSNIAQKKDAERKFLNYRVQSLTIVNIFAI